MSIDVREHTGADAAVSSETERSDVFFAMSMTFLAVDRFRDTDLTGLDDHDLRSVAHGIEALRNQTDTAAVALAAELERRGHQRNDGYNTSAAWMRHHLGLSTAESRVRMQVVRMLDALPQWEWAARNGQIGIEQLRHAARTFALTHVRPAFIDHADDLLTDAINEPCDRFIELLANLRSLADTERSRQQAAERHESRQLSMRRRPDGSWRLTATFGDLQGAEINHVLAHYIDAEWRTDWDDTNPDEQDAGVDALARTEPQRRADALHQMILAAATGSDSRPPVPTLNVLIDEITLHNETTGQPHDPNRYRDMVCRTQSGEPLPISEASTMALWAHLRRVVLDAAGTIIDLGRRRRLFTGSARDAVLLTETTCIWHGCDAPVHRCEVDHTIEWGRRSGTTSPNNGAPMCKKHNLHKERHRYRVHRETDGTWTITRPDGTPLD